MQRRVVEISEKTFERVRKCYDVVFYEAVEAETG